MEFPTLFPNGDKLPLQPCIKNIPLDGYALHLMRYHDNRFGCHPRFIYYLHNLIRRHKSQETANLFFRQQQEHNIPTTIEEFPIHLQDIPKGNLPEHVMWFKAHLHGTKESWAQWRIERKN